MRHAGNFNPEWGYIAPAPNFMRTARLFVVAAAIGATASAAVVFSLMDRPAAEASVAARTLVQPVEPAVPARSAPLVAQVQTPSEPPSFSQTQRADTSSAMRPQGATVAVHARAASPAANESGAASTTQQRPAVAAALAEAPKPAPAPASAPRVVIRKPRAVARAVQPHYDLPRYAAPRYEPRYEPMQRGLYAFLRRYGSYGQEY